MEQPWLPPASWRDLVRAVFALACGAALLYVSGWLLVLIVGGHYTSLAAGLIAVALEGSMGLLMVNIAVRSFKRWRDRE